ncbi:MAG: hypothetical protein K2X90_00865 [Candidatus Babeliaceae bacterium]|nr:hypothetical protein [Candidatus Babeliaceae bacterium]
MRKKNLFVISLLHLCSIHTQELSQCKKIVLDKTIEPREIIETAVQEAIFCLQQLQGRLMEAVVHRWAEILKSYFERLLGNQINIQIDSENESVSLKNNNQYPHIDSLSILFAAMQGMHEMHENQIKELKNHIELLEYKIKKLETT